MLALADHYKAVRERITRQKIAPSPLVLIPGSPAPALPPGRMDGAPLPREVKRLIEPILEAHDVTWSDLTSRARHARLVAPRVAVWKLLRARGWTYARIGEATRREPNTVFFHLQKGCKND